MDVACPYVAGSIRVRDFLLRTQSGFGGATIMTSKTQMAASLSALPGTAKRESEIGRTGRPPASGARAFLRERITWPKPPRRGASPDGIRRAGWVKRVMDLCIAIPFTIAMSPVIALMIAAVWLDDRGPIFYRQKRRGLNGETFYCWKVRTMVRDADKRLQEVLDSDPERAAEWAKFSKLKDDPRITRVGGFLRRTSLDELPQLWNIWKGEMSIVGPRPIPLYEAERYGEDIVYYDAMLPGVVGLWQVTGRSNTEYAHRVQLDRTYAQKRSIVYDIGLLFRAIPAVLLGKGAV